MPLCPTYKFAVSDTLALKHLLWSLKFRCYLNSCSWYFLRPALSRDPGGRACTQRREPRWAENEEGAQGHKNRLLLLWPLGPPSPEWLGAWPEIRGPPASARTLPSASGGAFSAQNNAGSLKDWAAGDGCFSKHRASFAKQALIPRPGGPRCLLDVSRVAGGLCLAGRGALETQEPRRDRTGWSCSGLGRQSGLQRWG